MDDSTPPPHRYRSEQAWRDVDEYFAGTLALEDEVLVAARESGRDTTMPNAEVAANQGALLGLIVQMTGGRRILEFGTLAGYSTIWLARSAGPDGRVVTLELEQANADIARANLERAGLADRVRILVGSASESARALIDSDAEPFDVVFIDADKPNNPVYVDAALRLTGPGAVIIIDNVVRDGAVVDDGTADARVHGVRQALADIASHPSLDATAIQTVGVKGWDGLVVARRQ